MKENNEFSEFMSAFSIILIIVLILYAVLIGF